MSQLTDMNFLHSNSKTPTLCPPKPTELRGFKRFNNLHHLQILALPEQEKLEYAARIKYNDYIYWSTYLVEGKIINWNKLLGIACRNGNLELACYCATKGANDWLNAMLSLVQKSRDIDIAEWILAQEPSALLKSPELKNFAKWSCMKGDMKFLAWLENKTKPRWWRESPDKHVFNSDVFIGTCAYGNSDLIEQMLAESLCMTSLDISNQVNYGYCQALFNGHLKVVEILEERFPIILYTCPNRTRVTFRGGHAAIINRIIEKGNVNWDQALKGAMEGREMKVVENIIINHKNQIKNLAMHINNACSEPFGNLEMIKLFYEVAPDLTCQALANVKSFVTIPVVRFLEEKGISLNPNNLKLKYAVRDGLELVNYYIEKGATDFGAALIIITHECNTLSYRSASESLAIVKVLIERGKKSDPNFAAHIQVAFNNVCVACAPDLIYLLFDYGARDLDEALEYACRGGHIDVVNFLIAKGASNFYNALLVANVKGFKNIVALLQNICT